ncbi:MerC mercury resistance protein [Caulifigura coniformis]|uniref:MerC mercury resistance protein n=1 Tax=Caulifigura coniformis TaxID=2527983 RepID=A0A517SKC8_9PLAN|nr:MerC domain-containing protein [Caulifigura coniformis]QDT56579.1 MerC mercury resistance protein [Caulifigura coniformis]
MAVGSRSWINLSGMFLSVACVIHCMLMPFCLASLPNWGLSWLVSPRVHQVLALLGMGIGMATLVPGWRVHRRSGMLFLAFAGPAIMNYAAFAGCECCAATPAGEGQTATSGCALSCCAGSNAQANANQAPTAVEEAALLGGLFGTWQWLWPHPTAFGATLLAWAHCLNGSCRRRCCAARTVELEVVSAQ